LIALLHFEVWCIGDTILHKSFYHYDVQKREMIVFFFNFNKQSKQPLSSDFWPLRQQNNPFYQTKQVLQKTILLYNSIATNKSTFLALDNELFVR